MFTKMNNTLPAKLRSPPAKPPRRRYSSQSITEISAASSNRRNSNDQLKLHSKDNYDSLPSDWTHYITVQKCSKSHFEKNVPTFSNSLHSDSSKSLYIDDLDYVNPAEINSKSQQNLKRTVIAKDFELSSCHRQINYAFDHLSNIGDNQNHLKDEKLFNLLKCSLHLYSRKRHNSDPIPLTKVRMKDNVMMYNTVFNCKSNAVVPCGVLEDSEELEIFPRLKEVYYLSEEIKTLKEVNDKLWQSLCITQKCLNNADTTSGFSISDLVSSLYQAQQARDSAMEERLKVVLKERDTAIQELDELVQVVASGFDGRGCISEMEKFSDKVYEEIKNLLREMEITKNPSKLLQQQRILLTCLYHAKELKQDHILHELRLCKKEKEALLKKMHAMEANLSCLQISAELWNSDMKYWENGLLGIISDALQQRDYAFSKVGKECLEYNRFPRITNEETIPAQKSTKLENHTIDSKTCFAAGEIVKNLEPCTTQEWEYINTLKEHNLNLQHSLKLEIEKREVAEQKCSRLERLVTVLQKKISGLNIGILV